MIYWQLFWSFFQIGLFSFGGGYAAMPLIEQQVTQLHTWLTAEEFADLVTISGMTPGPIAINAATFVGIRISGLPGAIVATLGCVLPSVAVVSLLAFFYFRYREQRLMQAGLAGLRPAVVALIASAGITIGRTALRAQEGAPLSWFGWDWIAVAVFLGAFFLLRWKKPNPIWVMLGAGAVGGVAYLLV